MAFKINRHKLTILIVFLLSLIGELKTDKIPVEDVHPTSFIKHDETSIKPTDAESKIADNSFLHAFIAAFSVIIVSELGDKTFFIAAIMSMKYPRLTVFAGAISALALMTILSVVFGMVFVQFIPRIYTHYISIILFVIFGLKMLYEGYHMSPSEGAEEMEEVHSDIRKREDELNKDSSTNKTLDPETGATKKVKPSIAAFLIRIFIQAFTLTFVAEWGDRSQLTTIILSAREDYFGIIVGGIVGHSICTGLAVIGGRMIAQKISVRTVTIIGGVVFLIFAISSIYFDPDDSPAGSSTPP